MLVTLMEPLATPVTVGAKIAVRMVVPPGAIVKGVVTGEREKPVPEIEIPETVTVPVPLLVRTVESDEEVLTATLPKFSDDGVAVSGPGVVPVPLNGIERFGFDALLVTETVPLAAPACIGAKVVAS